MRRSKEDMYCYIEEWQRSGLSRKEFCKKHGIAASTFSYWYSKYRQSEGLEPTTSSSDFIKVNPMLSDSLEVVYPNGVRIRLRQNSSISDLRALIQLI